MTSGRYPPAPSYRSEEKMIIWDRLDRFPHRSPDGTLSASGVASSPNEYRQRAVAFFHPLSWMDSSSLVAAQVARTSQQPVNERASFGNLVPIWKSTICNIIHLPCSIPEGTQVHSFLLPWFFPTETPTSVPLNLPIESSIWLSSNSLNSATIHAFLWYEQLSFLPRNLWTNINAIFKILKSVLGCC